jgi:adenine-specific DNA-methyltransferase
MQWNSMFINKIQESSSSEELSNIWIEIKEKAFLSYKVKVEEVDKNMNDFNELTLEKQKEFLIEILDKNHLYVNLSEMNDESYNVPEKDKKLNRQFYGLQ